MQISNDFVEDIFAQDASWFLGSLNVTGDQTLNRQSSEISLVLTDKQIVADFVCNILISNSLGRNDLSGIHQISGLNLHKREGAFSLRFLQTFWAEGEKLAGVVRVHFVQQKHVDDITVLGDQSFTLQYLKTKV